MNDLVGHDTPAGRARAGEPRWRLEEFRRSAENLGFVRAINPKGFHRVAYHTWGTPGEAPPVVCVHGLTRHGGDFDPLARALSHTRHVICPDLVGRGASDWLPDAADYHLAQYNCDLTILMAAHNCETVDWVGTSLGGLCGIVMAGMPNSPIRRLVINDVAPEVPMPALRRVNEYLNAPLRFGDYHAVERHLREVYGAFGPMTDADWRHMAHTSVYLGEDGQLAPHFDPDIGVNFRRYWLFYHFKLWTYWAKITCPILIVRGSESDFLTVDLLNRMHAEQPGASIIEIDGAGHTPTLNSPEQIEPIRDWLEKT